MTTAVASEDGKFLYTAGKEGSIIKWDLCTGKKKSTVYKRRLVKGKQRADPDGHTDEIWTLALSSDGKYLASGGKDRVIGIWDVESADEISWVKGFTGHRDSISVSAPAFVPMHPSTFFLYSVSHSVNHHNSCSAARTIGR